MSAKLLALIPAAFLMVVGGIWVAQANGWVGDVEPSKGFASAGSIMAGLGVALAYVVVQSILNDRSAAKKGGHKTTKGSTKR